MGGTGVAGGVAVAWSSGTDVGRTRSVNEDASLAEHPVFVVADGMGGHEAGDVAAAMAVEQFRLLTGRGPSSPELVAGAIEEANARIHDAGASTSDDRAMGTTVVGLVLVEAVGETTWLMFNIGDSRVYRYADDRLEQLSTDHSYVQELVDAGQLDASEMRVHPHRNVVTRALGVDDSVQADLWWRLPEAGERFLLCSDGLSSEIDDDLISATFAGSDDIGSVAERLVSAALDAGGSDNVTVVVVDVVDVEPSGWADHITAPRDDATRQNAAVAIAPAPAVAGSSSMIDGVPDSVAVAAGDGDLDVATPTFDFIVVADDPADDPSAEPGDESVDPSGADHPDGAVDPTQVAEPAVRDDPPPEDQDG